MPIDITAKVTCDMCGRAEAVTLAEGMHGGRAFDADAPAIVRRLPHWELLGRDGYAVTDYHIGDARTLCEGCARRYRDQLEENRRAIEGLFRH